MISLRLVALLLSISLGIASAQNALESALETDIATLARIIQTADQRDVLQAQAIYNFHLDYLFEVGCTKNETLVEPALNLVMAAFCPAASPASPTAPDVVWTAATPPFSAAVPLVGFAKVKANYKVIAETTFECASQHNVINPIVTFSTDSLGRKTAKVLARLEQIAILQAAGDSWGLVLGWYNNVFTFYNNAWCISNFYSGNDHIVVIPGAEDPFATKPGSLPILP